MKKFTIALTVLIALTNIANAQIPNNGFETWENYADNYTGSVYEKPDLWNGSLPNNLVYSFSIEKNLDNYPTGTGQYSMKIQPDIANGVRGVAISTDGADPMTDWIPKPSFAINNRPTSLFLYYKCLPFGGDTIIGKVYFYKNGVVIGNPIFGTTQTISSWTALEVPMTYYTLDVPDSATIFFVTGAYVQHTESILYIDNLSFDTLIIGSVSEQSLKKSFFNLYPNPASDIIILDINNSNNEIFEINIYDVIGKLMHSEILKQNQKQINIENLANGIYMVSVKSKNFIENQKLIIQN